MLLILLYFPLFTRNFLFQVVNLLRKSPLYLVSVFATGPLHLRVNFVEQMKLAKNGLYVRVDGTFRARVRRFLAISKRGKEVLHPL